MKVLILNLFLGLFYITLVSCNSGGEGESGAISGAALLGGVAATGDTIPNAQIEVYGADGEMVSTVTSPLGRYQVEVGILKSPYLIKVKPTADVASHLVSLGSSEDLGKDINVTPLTHIIVSNVFGESDPGLILTNFQQEADKKAEIKSKVAKEKKDLKNALKIVAGSVMDDESFDLMSGKIIKGKGLDVLLDKLKITRDDSNKKIEIDIGGQTIFEKQVDDENSTYTDTPPSGGYEGVEDILKVDLDEALDELNKEETASKEITDSLLKMSQTFSSYKDCAGTPIDSTGARCDKINLRNIIRDELLHIGFKENGLSRDNSAWSWFCDNENGETKDEGSCTEISISTVELKNIIILELNLGVNEALVEFSIYQNGSFDGKELMMVKKSEDKQWRFLGNQNDFDISISSSSSHITTFNGTTNASTGEDYKTRFNIWLDSGAFEQMDEKINNITLTPVDNSELASLMSTYLNLQLSGGNLKFSNNSGHNYPENELQLTQEMVNKMEGKQKFELKFDEVVDINGDGVVSTGVDALKNYFYVFKPLYMDAQNASIMVPVFTDNPDIDELDICRSYQTSFKIGPKPNTTLNYIKANLVSQIGQSYNLSMELDKEREANFSKNLEFVPLETIITNAYFYLTAKDSLGRKFERSVDCQGISLSVDPLILKGIAASGETTSSGQIDVKGTGENVLSTQVNSPYQLDVRQLQSPYLVRFTTLGGKKLLSIGTSADIEAGKQVHVNPLTHLIVLNLFGAKTPDTIFTDYPSLSESEILSKLAVEKGKLIDALIAAEVLGEKGILNDNSIDPFNDPYILGSGQGLDKLLSYLDVDTSQSVSSGRVYIRSKDSDHVLVDWDVTNGTIISKPPPITTSDALAEITNSLNSHASAFSSKATSCSSFAELGACTKSSIHDWIVPALFHAEYRNNGMNRETESWSYFCSGEDDDAYDITSCQTLEMQPVQIRDIEIITLDTGNLEAIIKHSVYENGQFANTDIATVKKSSDGVWRFYGNRNHFDINFKSSSAHITTFNGSDASQTQKYETSMSFWLNNDAFNQMSGKVTNITLTPVDNEDLKSYMSDPLPLTLNLSNSQLEFGATSNSQYILSSDMVASMSEMQKFELKYLKEGVEAVDTFYIAKPTFLDEQNASSVIPILDSDDETLCQNYQTAFNVTARAGTALNYFSFQLNNADNTQTLDGGTDAEGKNLVDLSSYFNNLAHDDHITNLSLYLNAEDTSGKRFERNIRCDSISILVPDIRTPMMLKGHAFDGSIMPSGSIVVQGKGGNVTTSLEVGPNGFYQVDVKDLTSPFLIQYTIGLVTFLSIGNTVDVETPRNINVTPLTHLIVANIFEEKNPSIIIAGFGSVDTSDLENKILTEAESLIDSLNQANVLGNGNIVEENSLDQFRGSAIVPGTAYYILLDYLLVDFDSESDILIKIRSNPTYVLIRDPVGSGQTVITPRPEAPDIEPGFTPIPAGDYLAIQFDQFNYPDRGKSSHAGALYNGPKQSLDIGFFILPIDSAGVFGVLQQMGTPCGGSISQNSSTGLITITDSCDHSGTFSTNGDKDFRTYTAGCYFKIAGIQNKTNTTDTYKELKIGNFYRVDAQESSNIKWYGADYIGGEDWTINKSRSNNCFSHDYCDASNGGIPTVEDVGIVDCSDPNALDVYNFQDESLTNDKLYMFQKAGDPVPSIPSSIVLDVEDGETIVLNGIDSNTVDADLNRENGLLKVGNQFHHSNSFSLAFDAPDDGSFNPVKRITGLASVTLDGQPDLPFDSQGSSFTVNGFYYLSFGVRDELNELSCNQNPKYRYLVFDIVTKKGYAIKPDNCGVIEGENLILPFTIR